MDSTILLVGAVAMGVSGAMVKLESFIAGGLILMWIGLSLF